MANYGLLRDVLKTLFDKHVLYDTTIDNGIGVPAAFETLEELCESKDGASANLGRYFRALKESGKDIDPGYVKSCIKLMKGQSVLFCNPFSPGSDRLSDDSDDETADEESEDSGGHG